MFVLTSFVSPVSYITNYAPFFCQLLLPKKNGCSISGLPGQLYTKFKAAHSCTYFGFPQEQQTNKSMRYHSCQDLHIKNGFPKSGPPGQLYTKFKAAHSCIYFGFPQEQQTNKSVRYHSCQDLHIKNGFPKSGLPG